MSTLLKTRSRKPEEAASEPRNDRSARQIDAGLSAGTDGDIAVDQSGERAPTILEPILAGPATTGDRRIHRRTGAIDGAVCWRPDVRSTAWKLWSISSIVWTQDRHANCAHPCAGRVDGASLRRSQKLSRASRDSRSNCLADVERLSLSIDQACGTRLGIGARSSAANGCGVRAFGGSGAARCIAR